MNELEERVKELENHILHIMDRLPGIIDVDPNLALIEARKAGEFLCRQICINRQVLNDRQTKESIPFDKMLNIIKQHNLVPDMIYQDLRTIQGYGNKAAHPLNDLGPLQPRFVRPTLYALSNVVEYYFENEVPTKEEPVGEIDPEPKPSSEPPSGNGKFKGKIRKVIEHPLTQIAGAIASTVIATAATTKLSGRKK